jgi:prepilin-type N-terminal cleavage/methylation domain-containing protein
MSKGTKREKTRKSGREAGFTLVEILIASAFLAVAACGVSAVLTGSMSMSAVNKETAQARHAAQRMLEELQNVPSGDIFATFNNITKDDPLGEATAPGGVFAIHMKPAAIQVSNMTGEVMFPESEDTGELREDIVDESLGMPRDLNGDGEIDSENHAKDYLYLPVRIRIRWRGLAGDREYELYSVILNK